MKSPLPQPPKIASNGNKASRYDLANKVGKHQLVSLNGDSVSCNSVELDEALACDVAATPAARIKSLCVHIRENKWYDAGNVVSVGVAGTSLNHALESISLTYDPATKQLYSEDAKNEPSEATEDAKEAKDEEQQHSASSSPRSSLPRSCSSTVSSLSEFFPSGSSSLGSDEQQHSPGKSRLWSATSFVKSVFSWKSGRDEPQDKAGSPSRNVDKIGGSLALIQQPRPANLPAKSADEEESHRRQYDAILEAARKRELREEVQRRQQREQQLKEEKRLVKDSDTWNTHILPKFGLLKDTKKVRDLWWRGLPPSVRGKVWRLAVANNLNVTEHLYTLCLDHATSSPTNEALAAIRLDVARTFPGLCVFQEGGPLNEALKSLLAAYAVYRPDIGYVQGMSFIGAMLALNMEPFDAFSCFSNLLNRPCHRAAFALDQDAMNAYYKAYSNALAHKLPRIHSHFSIAGLAPDLYLLDWLYTIYAKAMPLDVTCRVWDVFLRDGEEFLFRTALGVLHLYQEELLTMDFVRGAQFLTRLPENMEADALFCSINQMSLGNLSFRQMVAQILAS